jgi:Phage integrase, N-terminal SAM-like domain
MTGHIRRRGARSFELKFDLGTDPVTGKRRIRYASFKGTKRDAEIELARLIAQNAAGQGVDPSKATLAQFIERWDRDWASVNVGRKTLERYRQICELYVVPHIGSIRVQKLRRMNCMPSFNAAAAAMAVRFQPAQSAMRTGSYIGRLGMPPLGAWSRRTSLRSSPRPRHPMARSRSLMKIRSAQRCTISKAALCTPSSLFCWGLAPAAARRWRCAGMVLISTRR